MDNIIFCKSEIPASSLFILSEIDFFLLNHERATLSGIINYELEVES